MQTPFPPQGDEVQKLTVIVEDSELVDVDVEDPGCVDVVLLVLDVEAMAGCELVEVVDVATVGVVSWVVVSLSVVIEEEVVACDEVATVGVV